MANETTDPKKFQKGLDVRAAITKATGLKKVGGKWAGERASSVTRKSTIFKLTLEEKLRRKRAEKVGEGKKTWKQKLSRVRGGGGLPMNLKIGGGGVGVGQRTPWKKKKILL